MGDNRVSAKEREGCLKFPDKASGWEELFINLLFNVSAAYWRTDETPKIWRGGGNPESSAFSQGMQFISAHN